MNKSQKFLKLLEKLEPPKGLPDNLQNVLDAIEHCRRLLDPSVYTRRPSPEKK